LQTSSWETDGIKKYRTEIIADRVQFGPKRDGGANTPASPANQTQTQETPKEVDTIEYPEEEINPEDIPF